MDKPSTTRIGTHNSMSYLKPKHWWMWFAIPIARCQSINIEEQIKVVDVFDIRVSLNNKDKWEFRHGIVAFKSKYDIYDVINMINKNKVVVRLILEKITDKDNADYQRHRFVALCRHFEMIYTNITFIGGWEKGPATVLYNFKSGDDGKTMTQYVGSMASDAKWYEKIIPWFYAKRMNKKNFSKAIYGYNIYDYINIK